MSRLTGKRKKPGSSIHKRAATINSAIGDWESVIDQTVTAVLTEQTAHALHCDTWVFGWHAKLQDIAGDMADDQLAQMRDSAEIQAKSDALNPPKSGQRQTADDDLQKSIQQALSQKQLSHFCDPDAPQHRKPTRVPLSLFLTTSAIDNGGLEQFETIARTRLIGEAVAKSLHDSPLREGYVKKLHTQEDQGACDIHRG